MASVDKEPALCMQAHSRLTLHVSVARLPTDSQHLVASSSYDKSLQTCMTVLAGACSCRPTRRSAGKGSGNIQRAVGMPPTAQFVLL